MWDQSVEITSFCSCNFYLIAFLLIKMCFKIQIDSLESEISHNLIIIVNSLVCIVSEFSYEIYVLHITLHQCSSNYSSLSNQPLLAI